MKSRLFAVWHGVFCSLQLFADLADAQDQVRHHLEFSEEYLEKNHSIGQGREEMLSS